ncbi:MAG: chromosomal replication initiator protein DnaA, partial [Deltaproteobacteria bacterium]|nr:chromosomal replication initiator protein DnaA [Deltaproteobacteria bacterium]
GVRGYCAGARICYISTEQFMNEFISSLRNNTMERFRRRFRKDLDVLLMDDIQFIAGKDGTQDEFFHTFNSLYDDNKQIVLTSDKYPQEIPELEERLRSRFQWGLIADIQAPELETRLAILKKKAEDEGIPLPNDVALYLADSIKSNVRELEGSLINLAAHASLENRRIDISFARETLKKVIALHQTSLTVENVQQTVCKHFNVSMTDLRGSRRHRSITFPRQVAMYLCRKVLNSSYPELGLQFGGKDHTTALAACRKITRLVSEDVEVRSKVEALERALHL